MRIALSQVSPVPGEDPTTGQTDIVPSMRSDVGHYSVSVPEAGVRVLQGDLRANAERGQVTGVLIVGRFGALLTRGGGAAAGPGSAAPAPERRRGGGGVGLRD